MRKNKPKLKESRLCGEQKLAFLAVLLYAKQASYMHRLEFIKIFFLLRTVKNISTAL